MSTIEERLHAVEERLRELEDKQAIQQVLYAYAHGLDYHDEEIFANVWTEDVFLDRVSASNSGRDDVVENYFRPHSHPPAAYHKHHVGVSRIMLDGDKATVHSYAFRLNNLRGGPVVFAYGRYRDEFVRCDDCQWRIARRRVDNEAMVPWDREDVAEFLKLDSLQEEVDAGRLKPSAHAEHLDRLHGGEAGKDGNVT